MLAGLMKYSGAVSKVRAMSARLMNKSDYEKMASLSDLSQVYQFLNERPEYDAVLPDDVREAPRGTLENLLTISMYKDFASLYRFVDGAQREFLENFFCKIEISLLKNVVKGIMDKEERKMDLSLFEDFFERHTCLELSRVTGAKDLDEFHEALRGTPYHAVLAGVIKPDTALFDIELRLDLYYFRRMWRENGRKLEKGERSLVEAVLGVEVDLMNLIWIFRVKRFYEVPDEVVYSYIIPIHHKLSRNDIKRLVSAKGVEEYIAAVNTTHYKGFFDDVRDDPSGIVRKYWSTVYSINKASERGNRFSLAPILAYMDYKDIEIRNIITVIEAVHYEMPQKEIMKRLIIMERRNGKWR